MRLLRNTKTSPQCGFARSASLTSADSVCTDLRKSTGCAGSTTLRSDRNAINGCAEAPIALSKASPAPLRARPGCVPRSPRSRSSRQACLEAMPSAAAPYARTLTGPARLPSPDRSRKRSGPARSLAPEACCRRELAPRRQQPTNNAVAPSDLGNIDPSSKLSAAIRAFSSAVQCRRRRLSRDHLDPTIGAALLPGIKHGICHSPPPKDSSYPAVSQLIRAMPRWGLIPVTIGRQPPLV
ncbi:hypothetical protein ACVI1L_004794 [Bradyrhizobium sp. USDA 4516]